VAASFSGRDEARFVIGRHPRRLHISLFVALLLGWAVSSIAVAQMPHQVTAPEGSVGPPDPGVGSIRVRILPAKPGDDVAGLPVVLYALQPDGRPGLVSGDTNASGEFIFKNLNNSPDVTYLIGTRKDEVPFGRRMTFLSGEIEAVTEVQLQSVKDDASQIQVSQTLWLLDWIGSQLLVQVSQQITNSSDHVLYVKEEERKNRDPLFEVRLPPTLTEFLGASENLLQAEANETGPVYSFGPFYPGDQEIRYGFLAESREQDGVVEIQQTLPLGTAQAAVLLASGMEPPLGSAWTDTGENVVIGEESYRRFEAPAIEPGGSQVFAFQPPPSSSDSSALRVTRADYWIDHDDTEIRVNANLQLDVASPFRLMAGENESLLHIDLPEGAEFQGLTVGTSALGVVPSEKGGLEVKGPLPSGPSSLGYRYRLAVRPDTELNLSVSKEVDMLNVLVADNGVIIESERLHRQRPFKQGTRFYLHRQAYRVNPEENISIRLTPIGSSGLSQNGARIAALVAGGLAAIFLVAPLRTRRKEPLVEDESTSLTRERESIYESIEDLQNDLETGKIEEADYKALHAELHASAVQMLRQEQSLAQPETVPGKTSAIQSQPDAICPQCKARAQAGWRFCAQCGAPVDTSLDS